MRLASLRYCLSKTGKLFRPSLLQGDILRTIGHPPDTLMQRVDAALNESLALA